MMTKIKKQWLALISEPYILFVCSTSVVALPPIHVAVIVIYSKKRFNKCVTRSFQLMAAEQFPVKYEQRRCVAVESRIK